MNMFCKNCGRESESNKEICSNCELGFLEKKKKQHKSKWGVGKWSILLIVVVSLFLLRIIVPLSFDMARTKGEERDFISSRVEMQNLADEIEDSIGVPFMVDEITRLDNVEGDVKTISYYYTLIGYNNDNIQDIDFSIVRNATISSLCPDKDIRIYIDNDATFNYIYSSYNGDRLKEYSINLANECR